MTRTVTVVSQYGTFTRRTGRTYTHVIISRARGSDSWETERWGNNWVVISWVGRPDLVAGALTSAHRYRPGALFVVLPVEANDLPGPTEHHWQIDPITTRESCVHCGALRGRARNADTCDA